MTYDDAGDPGDLDPTTHYAALIRLQVTLCALQDLMWAVGELDTLASTAIVQAYENAGAAIQIALGGRHDVPEHLMRNWADAAAKRDASKVLKATGRGGTP